MCDNYVLQPHRCKQYHDSVADRGVGWPLQRGVSVKPSGSSAHMHTLYPQVQLTYPKKVKYFWIYETLKTIVFMFYCKDVKYDMCELEKKS